MVIASGLTINPARSSLVTLTLTVPVIPSKVSSERALFTVRLIVVDVLGTVLLLTPVTMIVCGTPQLRVVNVSCGRLMVATDVLLLTRSTTTLPEAGLADNETVKVAVPFSATVTVVGLMTSDATSLLVTVTGIFMSGNGSHGLSDRASLTEIMTASVWLPIALLSTD